MNIYSNVIYLYEHPNDNNKKELLLMMHRLLSRAFTEASVMQQYQIENWHDVINDIDSALCTIEEILHDT